MYNKALKYSKSMNMPVEVTELCNLGKWKVGSKSLDDEISSFILKIGILSSSNFAIGITKPLGIDF